MMRQIAGALGSPSVKVIYLDPLGAEPDKRTDGMVVYANGSDWDPGSGAGVYCREAGAWVKL